LIGIVSPKFKVMSLASIESFKRGIKMFIPKSSSFVYFVPSQAYERHTSML
jgi:hypothetical protein